MSLFFELSTPPGEGLLSVTRVIDRAASETDVRFLLIGAAARDLVLVNRWGLSGGRATRDIDFGLAVQNWAEFERLRDRLLETRLFRRDLRQTQRLTYREADDDVEIAVDFVPFDGVASADRVIAWPPDGDFVMNVAGFDEALASAVPIRLEPGLVLAVASLPGLAILKLMAWNDRHAESNKDAADLWMIVSNYAEAGNQTRIYDQEIDLLERCDYDLALAGSVLLGRDVRGLAGSRTLGQIRSLLRSVEKSNLLLRQMLTSTYEENAEAVQQLFEGFREGLTSRGDR